MQLQKATRQQVKLRLGLSAVAGGGKTMGALLLAKGLVGSWDKIAVIDTENKSASLYAHLGDYNTLPLDPPYTPERYIEAIKMCEDGGMEAIIIDSITHEWDGKGGCLEIMDKLGGKYQDWAKVTPRHQAFIEAILQSKCHVITSVRRKQDYEMTKVDGKVKVEKAGLKEVTREGFEYELTLNFNIDERHNATASKDRTGLFMDKPAFVIDESTGVLIKQWCESGVDANAAEKEVADKLSADIKTATAGLKKQLTVADLSKYWEKQPAEVRADKPFIQAVTARKAELLKEELTSFIEGLSKVTTPKEHEQYHAIVPAYIVADASFIDAAKKRYNVVMAAPATT